MAETSEQSQANETAEKQPSGNNKIIAGIIIAIAILAIGGFLYFSNQQNNQDEESLGSEAVEVVDEMMEDEATEEAMEKQEYTLAEVAEHSTPDDCWLALDGKVYDVTPFIASGQHPGGEAILEGCGTDATQLYETRPMGTGTAHSETARGFLPNFEIGTLAQ